MPDWPRVAVVGGSLGGLTAALVLRDLGCEVDVFERSTAELESRGAGIVVLEATVRYLRERTDLDLGQLTTATGHLRYLGRDGGIVYQEPRRYRYSAWHTIYRALLGRFGRRRYHLGRELVGFEQRAGQVDLRFADGSEGACELLVSADGIASRARAALQPQARPAYAGYVAWRGTVGEGRLGRGRARPAGRLDLLPARAGQPHPLLPDPGAGRVGGPRPAPGQLRLVPELHPARSWRT